MTRHDIAGLIHRHIVMNLYQTQNSNNPVTVAITICFLHLHQATSNGSNTFSSPKSSTPLSEETLPLPCSTQFSLDIARGILLSHRGSIGPPDRGLLVHPRLLVRRAIPSLVMGEATAHARSLLTYWKHQISNRLINRTDDTWILLLHAGTKKPPCACGSKRDTFYKYISRTSAVSSTNFGSIFIFASCAVRTCNIPCGWVFS